MTSRGTPRLRTHDRTHAESGLSRSGRVAIVPAAAGVLDRSDRPPAARAG